MSFFKKLGLTALYFLPLPLLTKANVEFIDDSNYDHIYFNSNNYPCGSILCTIFGKNLPSNDDVFWWVMGYPLAFFGYTFIKCLVDYFEKDSIENYRSISEETILPIYSEISQELVGEHASSYDLSIA